MQVGRVAFTNVLVISSSQLQSFYVDIDCYKEVRLVKGNKEWKVERFKNL